MTLTRKNSLTLATILLLAPTLGACAAAADGSSEEPLAQTDEEIINGNLLGSNANAVAIYHKITTECLPDAGDEANGFTNGYSLDNAWWPRPCSGWLIRKNGNSNYILTARHCVTKDGSISGPLLGNWTNMMATSRPNPGVIATSESNGSMTVLGSPPAGSLQTSVFYQNYLTFGDLAIVRTEGDLQPTQTPMRPGVRGLNDSQSYLPGKVLTAHGYGRSQTGDCYRHATSGAGQLRVATTKVSTAPSWNLFTHTLQNGAALSHGDSGGPLFTATAYVGAFAFIIYGVNSGPTRAAGGTNLADFFQKAFGHVYLAPEKSLSDNRVVGVTSTAVNSLVYTSLTVDDATTRMRIDRTTGRLQIGANCLADVGLDAQVRLRPCTDPYTSWTQTTSGAMRNQFTGRCLHQTNQLLKSTSCNQPMAWAFTADNAF